MVSIKSMNVNNLVIIVLIIIFDSSNATKCTDELINNAKINRNSNGAQAFEYIYRNFNIDERSSKLNGFLSEYIKYLYEEAIAHAEPCKIVSPYLWCANYVRDKFHVYNHQQLNMDCKKYMNDVGFDINRHYTAALKTAHYKITTETAKNMDEVASSYYDLLLEKITPCLAKLMGPAEYCYSNKGCLNPIIKNGFINANMNGPEAFKHAYHNINHIYFKTSDSVILRQYLHDLFEGAITNFNRSNIEDPLIWCRNNITDFFNKVQKHEVDGNCYSYMYAVGFDISENAIEAMRYAFYNIVSGRQNINALAKEYYNYMFRKLQPFLANSDAAGPIQYCNPLKTGNFLTLSIDQSQPNPEQYLTPNSSNAESQTSSIPTNQFRFDLNEPAVEDPEQFPYTTYISSQPSSSTYGPGYSGSTSGPEQYATSNIPHYESQTYPFTTNLSFNQNEPATQRTKQSPSIADNSGQSSSSADASGQGSFYDLDYNPARHHS